MLRLIPVLLLASCGGHGSESGTGVEIVPFDVPLTGRYGTPPEPVQHLELDFPMLPARPNQFAHLAELMTALPDGRLLLVGYPPSPTTAAMIHTAVVDPVTADVEIGARDLDLGYDNGSRIIQPTFVRGMSDGFVYLGLLDQSREGKVAVVARLDRDLDLRAHYAYHGTYEDHLNHIEPTADGGFLLSGSTRSLAANNTAAWVLELDSSLTLDWMNVHGSLDDAVAPPGGSGNQVSQSSAYTAFPSPSGGYVLGGTLGQVWNEECAGGSCARYEYHLYIAESDEGGAERWTRDLGPPDGLTSATMGLGAYPMSGDRWLLAGLHADMLFAVLSADGRVQRARSLGGNAGDALTSISPTSDGGFVVCGESSLGSGDQWLLAGLDSEAEIAWSTVIDGVPTGSVTSACYALELPDGAVAVMVALPPSVHVLVYR